VAGDRAAGTPPRTLLALRALRLDTAGFRAQVASRVGVLWGIVWVVPEVQTSQLRLGSRLPLPWGGSAEPALDVSTLVLAWSVSEIIRYSFYFCKARRGAAASRSGRTHRAAGG
jgi:hypothetical protein